MCSSIFCLFFGHTGKMEEHIHVRSKFNQPNPTIGPDGSLCIFTIQCAFIIETDHDSIESTSRTVEEQPPPPPVTYQKVKSDLPPPPPPTQMQQQQLPQAQPQISPKIIVEELRPLLQARLPDDYSQLFRLYAFGPSGLKDYGSAWGSATLCCKI